MSGVQEQQQQQQQPVYGYPNTAVAQSSSGHHSSGSFGAVFIVLAVIVVISALACFLGRLCSRRVQSQKPPSHSSVRPKGKEGKEGKEAHFHHGKEGDIEFGFDMRNPAGKFAGGGNGGGSKGKGKGKVVKPFENGNEIKHCDHEGEFKAAA